ncbi:class I SAM-dependent methyltransferase [Amycolatopsis alkalitolerans]|uniref:Class I SAM-dependent methyltransferase n=1 Tax=Amycolatopsis alkalitolerans TaxID=2547244 RepID=A0A5C4MBN9_9PSEU|nr:class I SAM-dependent methyltransferase [Amycolatopsis alkalitolerans]TNC29532.1 class I SAM-dependent methyltransferase [Amycolatopsis alkalitolerans]
MSIEATKAFWALGDYRRIAGLIADLGQDLATAADLRPGQRVLDTAAGTGNASLPAARSGAEVTAADLTPELMAAGARQARTEGLRIRWIEADTQALPFGDGEFDVVLSCVGAMFAPDHAATARELLRVCRPGGRLALANWTPGGAAGHFFRVLAAHTPPAGAWPPTAWGDPAYVARLLGPGCSDLRTTTRTVTIRFDGPPERLVDFYRRHFAPVIAAYAGMAGDAERIAALDADLLAFARQEDSGPDGGPSRYDYEYLQVIGTRKDA